MKQLQLVKQKKCQKTKKRSPASAIRIQDLSPKEEAPALSTGCKTLQDLNLSSASNHHHVDASFMAYQAAFFPLLHPNHYLFTFGRPRTSLRPWQCRDGMQGSTRCLSHPGLDLCVAWERKSQLKYKNPLSTAKCFKNKRNPKSCVGVCVCKMV